MQVKTLVVGHIDTNCYVVINDTTLECVVIDPGDESNTILDYLEDNHLKLKAILITHGHFDHVGALKSLLMENEVPFYLNERDISEKRSYLFPVRPGDCWRSYDDGDCLELAGMTFHIMSTPGHTPGGVSIYCEDALFSGDTLFKGSAGRCDLDGGDEKVLLQSLKKLCALGDTYDLYPGHGDPTTLFREKSYNYYCREAM